MRIAISSPAAVAASRRRTDAMTRRNPLPAVLFLAMRTGASTTIALVVGLRAPAPAEACLYPIEYALKGYPQDRSTDVPTDVIPVFDAIHAPVDRGDSPEATFTLRSESGRTVPVTYRRDHASHFDLVPRFRLEPRTRYTIRVVITTLGANRRRWTSVCPSRPGTVPSRPRRNLRWRACSTTPCPTLAAPTSVTVPPTRAAA
jgi:hypothetical protein